MNNRTLLFTVLLTISINASAEVCKSSSQLHQEKLDRYAMPTFPSLLRDCGLDSILDAFGGKLFAKINIPDFGNFCGYSAKDIDNWYGAGIPDSVVGGVDYHFEGVDVEDLLGGQKLFEVDSSPELDLDIE